MIDEKAFAAAKATQPNYKYNSYAAVTSAELRAMFEVYEAERATAAVQPSGAVFEVTADDFVAARKAAGWEGKLLCPGTLDALNTILRRRQPAAVEPGTPRPGAPRDVASLPDWWDEQRRILGKDASTCAAELRLALGEAGARVELPTREEIARGLFEANACGPGDLEWEDVVGQWPLESPYFKMADYVLSLLRDRGRAPGPEHQRSLVHRYNFAHTHNGHVLISSGRAEPFSQADFYDIYEAVVASWEKPGHDAAQAELTTLRERDLAEARAELEMKRAQLDQAEGDALKLAAKHGRLQTEHSEAWADREAWKEEAGKLEERCFEHQTALDTLAVEARQDVERLTAELAKETDRRNKFAALYDAEAKDANDARQDARCLTLRAEAAEARLRELTEQVAAARKQLHDYACPSDRDHFVGVLSDILTRTAVPPVAAEPVTADPDAPRRVELLSDWWDARRARQGKDRSRCAAELRVALAAEPAQPKLERCTAQDHMRELEPFRRGEKTGPVRCSRCDGSLTIDIATSNPAPAKPQVTPGPLDALTVRVDELELSAHALLERMSKVEALTGMAERHERAWRAFCDRGYLSEAIRMSAVIKALGKEVV